MVNKKDVVNFIYNMGSASVKQICEEFSCSESTARRILKDLSDKKLIKRYHGGANALSNPKMQSYINSDIMKRTNINKEKKTLIARTASKFIKENSTIILLGGSTVCELCKFIKNMNITVITNSILVLNELQDSVSVKIILLGGTFDTNEFEVNGILSSVSMNYIRADIMFMGASSFDEMHGFTTAYPAVDLYLTCLKSCLEACVLVDSSKYKKGGTAITARPDQINYLFTDSSLNRHAIDTFREKGVKVIISDI